MLQRLKLQREKVFQKIIIYQIDDKQIQLDQQQLEQQAVIFSSSTIICENATCKHFAKKTITETKQNSEVNKQKDRQNIKQFRIVKVMLTFQIVLH